MSPEHKRNLAEDMSSVLLSLVDLSVQCKVDLPVAVFSKLQKSFTPYDAGKNSGGLGSSLGSQGDGISMSNTHGGILPNREREEGDGSE